MRLKTFFYLLLLTLIGAPSIQADLLISPTRVFFNQRERVQKVILKNTSDQQKTYRIFFKSLQMDEMGIYHEMTADKIPVEFKGAPDNAAAPYIRYSPRMVTVKPNEAQTVRLFLRRKSNMDLKEYRSHLAFKEIPPKDFGRVIGSDNKKENTIRLLTLFEVTIPVIVKNGSEDAEVIIDQLKVLANGDKPKLKVLFNRSGGTSSYGNIIVKYRPEGSDTFNVIGQVNRFFVFYPGKKRQIDIPLETSADVDLNKGVIQVSYNKLQSQGGGLIAVSELELK